MIKFGAMYLNQGEWNGQRIVAEEWVRKSAIPYPGNERINVPGEHSGRNGYGLSWWTNSVSNAGEEVAYFFAGGWGGQVIIVVPEKRSVVVFTGGNYLRAGPHWKIFRKYIVPAFQ